MLQSSEDIANRVFENSENDDFMTRRSSRARASIDALRALHNSAESNLTRIRDAQQLLDDHNQRINTVTSIVAEAQTTVNGREQVGGEATKHDASQQTLNDDFRVQTS